MGAPPGAHAVTPVEAPITVLIIEDHLAVRTGLEMLLRSRGFDIAGVAEDAAGGLRLAASRAPDVAVVDLALREGDGIEVARALSSGDATVGVVIHTGSIDAAQLDAASACGARGFVMKTSDAEILVRAIQAVARGDVFVDPTVQRLLGVHRARRPRTTSREREILQRLSDGETGEQIATAMYLSPETVRTHLRNTMRKLEASTRVQAVAIALRDGEIVAA